MLLSKDEVVREGHDFETVAQFCERHGIRRQAVYYLAKADRVDYMKPGGAVFVVLTPYTLAYTPRGREENCNPISNGV